ncbi:MAG: hypothetical protein ACRD20_00250 [Terriglobales bacterium]
MHNKDICEYAIDSQGMHIQKPFRNVTGILSGNPHQVPAEEITRMNAMFKAPGKVNGESRAAQGAAF